MELRLLRYFVAVAEEGHVGRAAARLRMTQPPLSRAVRQLESELGVDVLVRRPGGVELTAAGRTLYREARAVLDRAAQLSARVAAASGSPTITVGTCADTADQLGSRLVTEFRTRHPDVGLTLYETDLTDPTAGLRTDVVDVALARAPFDATGIETQVLREDAMGVVLLEHDPLARSVSVTLADLGDRRWVCLPEGTDATWSAYWRNSSSTNEQDAVVVRTIQESLQSVLWSSVATFAPLNQSLPDGLVNVPVVDKEPSRLVVAWRPVGLRPLVRSFVDTAIAAAGARN